MVHQNFKKCIDIDYLITNIFPQHKAPSQSEDSRFPTKLFFQNLRVKASTLISYQSNIQHLAFELKLSQEQHAKTLEEPTDRPSTSAHLCCAGV